MAGAISVIVIGILVVSVQTKAQNNAGNVNDGMTGPVSATVSQKSPQEEPGTESASIEKWQEGTIEYNGSYYRYNNRLKNYLFMGIDTDDAVFNMNTKDTGYQSDALFLIVADSMNQRISVITINRNTITEIERFTGSSVSMGTALSQICVQHSYGDGKKLSCTRVEDAVSKLFYNIPIHGYLSLNMGGIPGMNDAIGGVTVEVLDDLYYENRNVNLKKGDIVKLNGQEAYCYLRGRDVNDFDSSTNRLRRQEQYITNFISILQASEQRQKQIMNMFDAMEDYTVTNIDFTKLLSTLLNYEYSADNLYTVPGETKMGSDEREEYHVDEEDFYDMIISIFYEEVLAR